INQIDPVIILRRKILTINRFLLSKFAFFDSDQFIAKLSRSHQFDLRQFIVFCRFFSRIKN
ncbi:hypothetical protein EB655_23875, partial [Escherichia coli]|nr:hypothetical protein [Escherichia coli]